MKNFVQPGDVLNLVLLEDEVAVSGMPFFKLGLVGIPVTSSSTIGDVVALNLEGVYSLPKTAPLAIDQGDRLYWDEATSKVTKTTTGNRFIGIAFDSALSAATTTTVRLQNEGSVSSVNITALVDNSGGAAANGTIEAITAGTPADLAAQGAINALIANAIKELATKVNQIAAVVR